jgi:phosphinothricin acetyltransferase
MMDTLKIRMATQEDAKEILDIYEPYILNTVITFETERIPLEEFKERMQTIMSKFPWLVCTLEDKVVGYAYCSPHLTRAAYAWDCQYSVYVSKEYHRKGIASKLSEALFRLVKAQGYYNIYSLICVPNINSVELHKKLGFMEIGTYEHTAYKFGAWRDVLIMGKALREADCEPTPIITMEQLDKKVMEEAILVNSKK